MAEEEARGFLGRWARRKTDAMQGKPLQEPVVPAQPAHAASPPAPLALPAESVPTRVPSPAAGEAGPPDKVLSLDDVKALTPDSDFKPFMAREVGPEVRNAAMKKLFADPHFNVMDGLDIYIDDYSKPDPIPEAMLRQMTSAKFLNLFDEEGEDADKQKASTSSAPGENANDPTDQTVAQSYEETDITRPESFTPVNSSQPEPLPGSGASQEDHAHTDLRLQPDHAPPAPDAGRGTQ